MPLAIAASIASAVAVRAGRDTMWCISAIAKTLLVLRPAVARGRSRPRSASTGGGATAPLCPVPQRMQDDAALRADEIAAGLPQVCVLDHGRDAFEPTR